MLYQDFSKDSLKKIFHNMITIFLISVVQLAALIFFGMAWISGIFISLGIYLTLNYIYLRYIVENLYESGPYKIFVKSQNKLLDQESVEWIVSSVENKEIILVNLFNITKRIHWKELDNYKLKS